MEFVVKLFPYKNKHHGKGKKEKEKETKRAIGKIRRYKYKEIIYNCCNRHFSVYSTILLLLFRLEFCINSAPEQCQ